MALKWNFPLRTGFGVGMTGLTLRWDVTFSRPNDFLQLRADAKTHHESVAARQRQFRDFYFAVAVHPKDPESSEEPDVSLFGFISESQSIISDLYIPSAVELIDFSNSLPSDLPSVFVSSLIDHRLLHSCGDGGVYPMCFEELTIWLIIQGL